MPKIDVTAIAERIGSLYPAPYDAPCATRRRKPLGDGAGLNQFGVNMLTLPPGAWSSQRHWHSHEDEFVYVLQGTVVLIDDAGETVLHAGDCAAFPKGDGNGHQLVNHADADALVLEVGSRLPEDDKVVYSDIDLMIEQRADGFVCKDGSPYPKAG